MIFRVQKIVNIQLALLYFLQEKKIQPQRKTNIELLKYTTTYIDSSAIMYYSTGDGMPCSLSLFRFIAGLNCIGSNS